MPQIIGVGIVKIDIFAKMLGLAPDALLNSKSQYVDTKELISENLCRTLVQNPRSATTSEIKFLCVEVLRLKLVLKEQLKVSSELARLRQIETTHKIVLERLHRTFFAGLSKDEFEAKIKAMENNSFRS